MLCLAEDILNLIIIDLGTIYVFWYPAFKLVEEHFLWFMDMIWWMFCFSLQSLFNKIEFSFFEVKSFPPNRHLPHLQLPHFRFNSTSIFSILWKSSACTFLAWFTIGFRMSVELPTQRLRCQLFINFPKYILNSKRWPTLWCCTGW